MSWGQSILIYAAAGGMVIPATRGGQFTTTGEISSAAKIGSVELFAVKIDLNSDTGSRALSMGSGGTAAIYTKKGKPVHIISRVTLRMKKWLLYVVPSVLRS